MNKTLCFFVLLVLGLYFWFPKKELFINYNSFERYLIKDDVKNGLLRDFLGDLNNELLKYYESNASNGICDNNVENISLHNAFNKISHQSDTEINTKNILNTKDPQIMFESNTNDYCINKASNLCETANPYFYLSESQNFPAKWIGPYKDTPLPKSTNLTCFNKMYDCCKSTELKRN